MTRRRSARVNWSRRCPACWLARGACVCAETPRHNVATRVALWIDRRETFQTSNTGHLIQVGLERVAFHVHARQRPGPDGTPAPDFLHPEGYRTALLYPSPEATPLAPAAPDALPLNLVVPDATWAATSRLVRRVPALAALPRVTLPKPRPPTASLRKPPWKGALSTLDAIAQALGVLEGDDVERDLRRLLAKVTERSLWARGELPPDALRYGLPPEAQLHRDGRERLPPARAFDTVPLLPGPLAEGPDAR